MKRNELRDLSLRKKAEGKFRSAKTLLEQSLAERDLLESQLKAVGKLQSSKSCLVIKPSVRSGKAEATAFAMATDWHIGSRTEAKAVNGLNSYNVAVAKVRASRFFERIVALTKKERQDCTITELVLFLGGDLIDGALHMDTLQAAEVNAPIRQAVIAQEIIEGGLLYLVAQGGFERITIVCADGNHGRITARQHYSSRIGNALEYYMYYNLRARHPEFNWVIEEGLLTYIKVYNYTVRLMHGDTISYGGVNGPYTYLNRRISEWDEAIKADLTLLGHLHRYIIGDGRKFVINGSMCGYNEYAIALGARFQPPMQAFFLLDKRRGMSVNIPILFS